MWDFYNSLPQPVQLWVAVAVVIVMVIAGLQAIKLRRQFSRDESPEDKIDHKVSGLYKRIKEVSDRHDLMHDKLESRVRENEQDIGWIKGKISRRQ